MTEGERIKEALELAMQYGGIDGDHHKAWVIDQIVRILTDCPMVPVSVRDHSRRGPYCVLRRGESEEYMKFVADAKSGEDGPETYKWDEGIAP